MADINLMPPFGQNGHSFAGIVATSTCKYGSVLVDGATGNHADVKQCTSAGETKLVGVCQSQGDPNNSGLFVVGDQVEVRDEGYAEVLFPAGTVIAMEDIIIASATAGHAKVLGAEAKPYMILGRAKQAITIGAAAGLASVKLALEYVPA